MDHHYDEVYKMNVYPGNTSTRSLQIWKLKSSNKNEEQNSNFAHLPFQFPSRTFLYKQAPPYLYYFHYLTAISRQQCLITSVAAAATTKIATPRAKKKCSLEQNSDCKKTDTLFDIHLS